MTGRDRETPSRRRILRAAVAAGSAGLAGCTISLGDDPEVDSGRDTPSETPDPTTESETPDPTTESATPTDYPTPSFDQDCLSHDLDAIEVEEDGSGGYQIVDGESILLAFDSFDNAKRARDLIEHYGFTRHCFVGRPDPPMTYWLVDGAPPVRDDGGLEGEDCLELDPGGIEVEEDGSGGYQIVDGESILLAFDSFDNAKRARDVIEHYGFTRHCFVGRPDPPMTYWLVDDA